jgi:hypothetical protein
VSSYVFEDGTGWTPLASGNLPNSGVTAATYGDSTHVGQFTVSAKGVITAASNVVITGGGGSSNVGYLGSATTTSTFTTANGTPTQITGLTVSVTIPASVHTKITMFADQFFNTTATNYAVLTLWDGTVGSGTQIAEAAMRSNAASDIVPATMICLVAPAAGAKTYNVGIHQVGGGSAGIVAGATNPALLLVEAI